MNERRYARFLEFYKDFVDRYGPTFAVKELIKNIGEATQEKDQERYRVLQTLFDMEEIGTANGKAYMLKWARDRADTMGREEAIKGLKACELTWSEHEDKDSQMDAQACREILSEEYGDSELLYTVPTYFPHGSSPAKTSAVKPLPQVSWETQLEALLYEETPIWIKE